jgi:hypothetical protein
MKDARGLPGQIKPQMTIHIAFRGRVSTGTESTYEKKDEPCAFPFHPPCSSPSLFLPPASCSCSLPPPRCPVLSRGVLHLCEDGDAGQERPGDVAHIRRADERALALHTAGESPVGGVLALLVVILATVIFGWNSSL